MFPKILKRKFKTVVNNPKALLIKLLYSVSPLLPDALYLKLLFPLHTGYKLNLENPKTYNEKLQWLKINYRKPMMTTMVDKYEAKNYARDIIGDEYIVKTLGVWDDFEQIDFDLLPSRFVLKTTHDQGGVVIVHDKNNFNKEEARKKLTKHLKFKHFYLTREWPYKNVKPRIMAEEYLENTGIGELRDYKFFCFHGEPKLMYISHGKEIGKLYLNHFDLDFNKLDISRANYPKTSLDCEKPTSFELMKDLAKEISSNLPHVRVDFYEILGKPYLGELTFYQGGGLESFTPLEWDYKLGSWLDLSKIEGDVCRGGF